MPLIYFGSQVKALGEGKFGGHLVLFTDETSPDLVGDFFTKETEFYIEDGQPLPVLYDHGLDPTVKGRKIGRATVRVDDAGLWLEGQLNLRDEYEKAIYRLIEEGKLGLSSGAAGHLTERKALKNASQITAWGIAEASLTPSPCEHRTSAIPLKTYIQDSLVSGEDIDAQLHAAVSAVREVTARIRVNHEARVKSGRVLSDKNRTRLSTLREQLQAIHEEIQGLLDETQAKATDEEKRLALTNFLRSRWRTRQSGVQ